MVYTAILLSIYLIRFAIALDKCIYQYLSRGRCELAPELKSTLVGTKFNTVLSLALPIDHMCDFQGDFEKTQECKESPKA